MEDILDESHCKYILPIDGVPTRDASAAHVKRMKYAVDFLAPIGTNTVASASGIVTDIGISPDGYKYVNVSHPDGKVTQYGHLSEYKVLIGQHVKQGQTIALSGDTGDLWGLPPHLHFEYGHLDSTENIVTEPNSAINRAIKQSFRRRQHEHGL